jgi:type III pantothenate kinase
MASSEDLQSRCLLIGNSRWHWAEQTGSSPWVYQHEPAAPEALDAPSDLLAWAAVGVIPSHPCLLSSRRLSLSEIPLQGIPPWLGIDRALAGWGAWRANQNRVGVLVVDAGTVLSLTRISADGSFSGGLLAAGYGLQLRAMGEATAGLTATSPLVMEPKGAERFPFETQAAMRSGAQQSLVGLIRQAHAQSPWPIWLCGGDSPQLLPKLQEQLGMEVLHAPNLVMEAMVELVS